MRQHLLIDADDTLWENNIYFEAAFDQFVSFLDHTSLDATGVRAVLDEIELANSRVHGYGSANFGRNLQQCYARLAERAIRDGDLAAVKGFALRILEQPMEPIEGVAETLAYLAPRHELTLFTKGAPDEQRMKIDASGLGGYFAHTTIVKEKNAAAYHALVAERELDARLTWMIGNSPKSDINPALEAGLNAVYVPHARTWTLERQPLIERGAGRLLRVERFADLRELF
jgi:putative hydrolase of the HAD superfamily